MRTLGILCARGASKRLPRKHLQPLGELPVVGWMCRAAAASKLTDVVLTTEDADIAAAARMNGVEAPFLRPAHLAEDYATDHGIITHALEAVTKMSGASYDAVVMLQPTTPFTLPEDIDACVARLEADVGLACCFTVRPVTEPADWMFVEDENGLARRLLAKSDEEPAAHKQLLRRSWFPSGAAYAVRVDALDAQQRIYCSPFAFHAMAAERCVDIDEPLDLIIAEAVMRYRSFMPAAPAPRAPLARMEHS